MLKFISLFLVFVSGILIENAYSQHNILLLTGKRVAINDYRIDSSGVILYKNTRNKVRGFEIDEVFSVTRKDSVEVIVYQPACKDVCFQIDQMRYFLNGEADGRKHGAFWYGAGGFVLGAAGAYVVPIMSPVPVAGYSGIAGAFNPKVEKMHIPPAYKDNPHYIEGYRKSLKRKRILTSMLGGGIGIVAGIGLLAVLGQ